MNTVKATVLSDNSVYGRDGIAEHGWAVWLETLSGNYLFDTGQGKTLMVNATRFGCDLGTADGMMISHHHYDHTGGLLEALRHMKGGPDGSGIPVYAHFDLFKESYAVSKGRPPRYIGIPFSRTALEGAGASLSLDHEWREVAERIYLSGEVPRRTPFEGGDGDLRHFDEEGELVPDPIRDDQTLVIETHKGLVVILGCSHAGVINILNYIVEKVGRDDFHTIIGGTHLGPAKEQQVQETVRALQAFNIQRIGASHCTGPGPAAELARAFGDRFLHCSVGTTVEV